MNRKNIIIILGTPHLSSTPGKCSPDGRFREANYGREIVTRLQEELEALCYNVYVDYMSLLPQPSWKAKSYKTEQTRELAHRVTRVNALCNHFGKRNCVYISIHNNAASGDGKWHSARGFSVFVNRGVVSDNSKKLARIFTKNAEAMNLMGNRAVPPCKYWDANLYVLKNTYCPAVLTENLFQDNEQDVDFLLSETGKRAIVQLHVQSIGDYVKQL